MKIVFNLLERHILKFLFKLPPGVWWLFERSCSSKNTSDYEMLLPMTLFLFFLLHHPSLPPPHLWIYLWRAFDWREREHRVRRITVCLSPRIKAKFPQLGTAWLTTECLSNFVSHLFFSRPSFSGQMGLPIASLLFNPLCRSPTPLHPNPVSSKSSASALCGIDWPYLELPCCFIL